MRTIRLITLLGVWIAASAVLTAAPVPDKTHGLIVVFRPEHTPTTRQGKAEKTLGKQTYVLRKLIPTTQRRASLKRLSVRATQAEERLRNMYALDHEDPEELAAAWEALRQSPEVLYVEPNLPIYTQAAPTDPMYVRHYGLENNGQPFWVSASVSSNGTPGADINWRPAWEAGLPTNDVLVAVIDTGVDVDHEDLAGRIWTNPGEVPGNGLDDDLNGFIDDIHGWSAVEANNNVVDDNGHGTHVAGSIAAAANNGVGMVGVNPHARIMAVRIFDSSGSGSSADGISAILYAVDNGANIINNSWGGYGYLQSLADAILYANEMGVVVVCAAGNSNTSLPMYPASYPGAISIAATDAHDNRASFSNYGAPVDLAAPGVSILSLLSADADLGVNRTISNKYAVLSGTSMASPHAAGAFSLLYAAFPGLDPWIYQRVMENTANTNIYSLPANTNYAGLLGTGRIDLQAALTYSATNLFVTARPLVYGPSGFRPLPGSTNALNVRVATWLTGVTNASVRAVALTSNVTFNTTNLTIGVVPGTTTLSYSNHFVLVVASNAAPGSTQSIRFDAYIGASLAESYTMNFSIFLGEIKQFALTDPINGQRDVIGWGGTAIGRYSPAGETRWTTNEGGSFYSIDGAALGDVNGDGQQEVSYWHGSSLGSASYVSLVNMNGQALSGWPKSLGYRVHRVMTADINGNGNHEVIVLYSPSANDSRVRAYNAAGSTLWTYTIGNSGAFLRMMSIGDLEGDGKPEIVIGSISGEMRVIDASTGATNRSIHLPGHSVSESTEVRLADLDGDGADEIVIAASDNETFVRRVFVVNGDGTLRDGWPVYARPHGSYWGTPDTQFADLDGDGLLEVFLADSLAGRLAGWNHRGESLFQFPIVDTGIVSRVVITDLDADGAADLAYLANYHNENGENHYDVVARDRDGLLLHGFPRRVSEVAYENLVTDFTDLAVGPLVFGGDETNVFILSTIGGSLDVIDTGYADDPSTAFTPSRRFTADQQGRYVHPSAGLRAGFVSTNGTAGIGSFTARFKATVSGDTNGLVYHWDFDNNGSFDATGNGLQTTQYTYTAPGTYTVRLVATNAAGETSAMIRTNYIRVFTGLAADFTANIRTAAAPIRIQFTDLSTPEPQAWNWTFGDGGTSTERDPLRLYTNAGTYTVTLSVSNRFGDGSSSTSGVTRTAYIHITGTESPTNIYVSKTGSHSYPFKNWAEAATNINEAVDAAIVGTTVHVAPGRWDVTETLVLPTNVTLRSSQGREVTTLDGGNEVRILRTYAGSRVEGFTLQHGYDISGGPAVYMLGGSVIDCHIRNNSSVVDGFIGSGAPIQMLPDGSTPGLTLVDNCIIEKNRSTIYGGVYMVAGSTASLNNNHLTMVRNTIFRDNDADGFMIFMSGRRLVLRNCLIENNRVGGTSLINTPIGSANDARIENCTIVGNTVASSSTNTMLRIDQGRLSVFNSIILSNNAPSMRNGTNIYAHHNLLQAPLPSNWSESINNATTLPAFVSWAAKDFRLAAGSPGIDAGTNYTYAIDTQIGDIRIDFGVTNFMMDGNWNHVTTLGAGTKIANLMHTNGTSSGASLEFLVDFTGTDTSGTRTTSTIYPTNALKDSLTVSGITNRTPLLAINNLDDNRVYDYHQLASTTNNKTLTYFYLVSHGRDDYLGLSQYYNNALSTLQALQVSPTNGQLRVDFQNADLTQHAYQGAIRLIEYDRALVMPQSNTLDLAGAPRLQNHLLDIGAYETGTNLAPRVNLSASTTTPHGNQTVTLTASATDPDGSIAHYVWNFGDGSPATTNGAMVNYAYPDQGGYVVTVTAVDNGGASANAKLGLIVSEPVPVAPSGLIVSTNSLAPATSLVLNWSDNASDEDGFAIERARVEDLAVDLIIDNNDPRVSGSLDEFTSATSASGYYGSNYLRNNSGAYYVYYTPYVEHAGWYDISIWYPASSQHSWLADVTVRHALGSTRHLINQQTNGAQWNLLGQYYLERGQAAHVQISASVSMPPLYTVADAVRFTRTAKFAPIGDAPANATNFTDTGLLDDTTYRYRVAATNAYGASPWSNEDEERTANANAYPDVAITGLTPPLGKAALNVTASGAATDADGIAQYLWNFGDGYTGSLQYGPALSNAVYVYRYPGTYTVTLDVTDNAGKTSSTSTNITVYNATEMAVAPSSLSFDWRIADPPPGAQAITISNTLVGVMRYDINANVSWLNIAPATGTVGVAAGGLHTASVITNNLQQGVSNAVITVTSIDATNSPVTIPVTLTIGHPILYPPATGETAVLRFDFGPADDITTGFWNNITDTASGVVTNPLDVAGYTHEGLALAVTAPFVSAIQSGTSSADPALGLPATATRDAFMGSLAEGLMIRWAGDYLIGTTARGFASGFGADALNESTIRAPDNANYNRSFTGGVFFANIKRLADNVINVSQVEDGSSTNTISVQLSRLNTTGDILGHGVFMWKQTNFVSGFNSVSAAPTEFSIRATRNQHGAGSNQVRWLVKEGEQYYVSQNAHVFVSHIPSNRTDTIAAITGWQEYSPTNDLEFTPGSFSTRTFSNVTAIGYYVRMFRASAPTGGILRLDVSEFSARGQIAGQSGDPAEVTLSGLNPNLAYALRFFASSTGETTNLDTEYRVTHASGVSAVRLNPANNTGSVAQTTALYPALDGTLAVQVRTGNDNNDLTGRYMLGAMEMEFVNDPLSTPPFDGGSYYNWTNETGRKVRFWIPNNLGIVRGILLVGNPAGGDAIGEANHASKQLFAQRHGFIILATGYFFRFADSTEGTNDWNALTDAFSYIVNETGRQEITNAPIVSYGYSNGGQISYNLMRLMPDRTIAFCANKGGFYNYDTSPRPHVPGIFIAGQADSSTRREAISNLYLNGRSEGAPWAWLEEQGIGHDHGNSEALLFAFYDEVIAQRYPPNLAPTATNAPTLLPVVETNGWLVSIQPTNWASGYASITPSAGYVGDKNAWGWVPSERIAHLFRAVASYDPGVSSDFTVTRKQLLTQSPLFGSYANTAVIYHPGYDLDMTVEMDPTLTDWQEVAFYDGENLLTTVTNAGTNVVFTYLTLDDARTINSVHARLKRADNSFRSSSVNQLMPSTYFAPEPPINLTSSTATNGAPTDVRNHAFSWARPANMASVPGYAFSLAGEPERASPLNVTNATYNDLVPGTYTFRVRAQSSLGYWGPSATFNLAIEGSFKDPTNLTAQAISATRIDLAWDDRADTETGYVVERRLAGDTMVPLIIDNADTNAVPTGEWTVTTESTPAIAWYMNEATNGAAITTIPNGGPQSIANWSANLTGSSVTDGVFRVRTTASIDSYAGNALLNYTTGVHMLQMDLSGWNVVGAINDQWLQLSFNTGNNAEISAGLVLQQTAAGLVFYGRALGTGGTDVGTSNAPIRTYNLTMTNPVSLRIVADFSGNTYEVFYRDATTTNQFTSGGSGSIASGRKGRSIRLRPSGDWSGASEFIGIQRIVAGPVGSGFYATDYAHDRATTNGTRSFAFMPHLSISGSFVVEMRHPSGAWHATNAPVVIHHAGGVHTALVNQATNGNTWFTLGTFDLDASSQIEVRNTNTTGYVVADAVRLTHLAPEWESIAILPANSTFYADLTVSPETGYEYRVRATNATEQSAWIMVGPVTTPADSNPDTDSDGIPDDWETIYFDGPTNAVASALASNGVNTLLEAYIAGLDPHDAEGFFQMDGATASGGASTVLTWNPSATGRWYSVWLGTNLHQPFEALATNLPGPQSSFTTSVHTLYPSTFIRIEVRVTE